MRALSEGFLASFGTQDPFKHTHGREALCVQNCRLLVAIWRPIVAYSPLQRSPSRQGCICMPDRRLHFFNKAAICVCKAHQEPRYRSFEGAHRQLFPSGHARTQNYGSVRRTHWCQGVHPATRQHTTSATDFSSSLGTSFCPTATSEHAKRLPISDALSILYAKAATNGTQPDGLPVPSCRRCFGAVQANTRGGACIPWRQHGRPPSNGAHAWVFPSNACYATSPSPRRCIIFISDERVQAQHSATTTTRLSYAGISRDTRALCFDFINPCINATFSRIPPVDTAIHARPLFAYAGLVRWWHGREGTVSRVPTKLPSPSELRRRR